MEAADWIRDDLLWSPLPCSCSVVGRWHDEHSAAMMVITHLSHDWPATQSPGESIAFKYLNDCSSWSNESVPPGYWPAAGKPCCLKGQRFQSMQHVRGCCEGIISPWTSLLLLCDRDHQRHNSASSASLFLSAANLLLSDILRTNYFAIWTRGMLLTHF